MKNYFWFSIDVIIVLYLQRFQIKDMLSIETKKCRAFDSFSLLQSQNNFSIVVVDPWTN